MLSRLFFTAWVGSHYTWAPEAAELAPVYTAGTCQLAEQYLSRLRQEPFGRSQRIPSDSPWV